MTVQKRPKTENGRNGSKASFIVKTVLHPAPPHLGDVVVRKTMSKMSKNYRPVYYQRVMICFGHSVSDNYVAKITLGFQNLGQLAVSKTVENRPLKHNLSP